MDGVTANGLGQRGSHASAVSATSTGAIQPNPLSAQGLKPWGSTLNRTAPARHPEGTWWGRRPKASEPSYTCSVRTGHRLCLCSHASSCQHFPLSHQESRGHSPKVGSSAVSFRLVPRFRPLAASPSSAPQGQLFPTGALTWRFLSEALGPHLPAVLRRRGHRHPASPGWDRAPLSTSLWLPRLLRESTSPILSRLAHGPCLHIHFPLVLSRHLKDLAAPVCIARVASTLFP